jgi:protein-tyrosine phosphatase
MAEALFTDKVQAAGLADKISIDSAGTGSWHIGERPHRGTQRILRENGIAYSGRARQITPADLTPETYIIAMDSSNINDLRRQVGAHDKVYRLLEFAANATLRDVPDPYYSGNFAQVFNLVDDGCRGLLAAIRQWENL